MSPNWPTAWQALYEHAGVRPGQHVLVHGGAGGVGAYAVQLGELPDAFLAKRGDRPPGKVVIRVGREDIR